MRASNLFISTIKEVPHDADIISHQLMIRAGLIKKLSAGIYIYMPLGLRVLRKIEAIIREEMERAGSIELLMPIIQPAELWQASGRFQQMGSELLRIKDRHNRDYIVQPTSEEVITDMANQDLRSYRDLPKNFYQIQTKFRDERRPRFGVMRGREFIMKDAYSFDKDVEGAQHSYHNMVSAYRRIFNRFGLRYRTVKADSGSIGGDLSEEFQVIANSGEDAIVYCPQSDYAANIETAKGLAPSGNRKKPAQPLQKISTPGKASCIAVADFLGAPLESTIKSLVLATDDNKLKNGDLCANIWLLLLRGDHSMNETKVRKLPGLNCGFRFATLEEIQDTFGCVPGYLGPIKTIKYVTVVADLEVAQMSDWICGANEEGFHMTGVNWSRDLPEPELIADIRNVVEGEISPDGKGKLLIERGIEIGHVFYFGTKYSKAMGASFIDENGQAQNFEMGSYGIGISRLPAAAIEQNHDDRGIIWPDAIAPFTVVLCPINFHRSSEVQKTTDHIYKQLVEAKIDVILDDRGERTGIMLADWELIGVPHRIVIGDKALKNNFVEYQHRRERAITSLPIGSVIEFLKDRLLV